MLIATLSCQSWLSNAVKQGKAWVILDKNKTMIIFSENSIFGKTSEGNGANYFKYFFQILQTKELHKVGRKLR